MQTESETLCGFTCVTCSLTTAQVKFNVNRVDNMVIQAIALLDTLDKDINTFVMRVREWYSWHFPELVRVVSDNYLYARLTLLIKDKAALSEALLPGAALSRYRLGFRFLSLFSIAAQAFLRRKSYPAGYASQCLAALEWQCTPGHIPVPACMGLRGPLTHLTRELTQSGWV